MSAVRRVRFARWFAAAWGLLAISAPALAQPRWTRVETEHFVVSGEVPAPEVRQVAFQLETFREVFSRVIPGARERSLIPPFVVVFGSEGSFAPYKPTYEGKPAPVGGYTVREPMAPCVALRLDGSAESSRTVFHEYAHVLFDPAAAPLWLSEGIADYYSTARVLRDRQHVELGRVIPGYIERARRTWIPLPRLLEMSRSEKIWGTETGQAFYAESWLLVHYLTRATSAKGGQIPRLLARLARGEDDLSAFDDEIGPPSSLDAELRQYVSRLLIAPSEVVELPAEIGVKAARERTLTPAQVEATLGRLSYQLQRDDEASSKLTTALALEPDLAEAHLTLGLLALRQGRPAEAVEPLRRANASDPRNLLVAYDYALASLQGRDAGFTIPLEPAFDALGRVVGPNGPPEALAVLGTVAGRLGRLAAAEPLLRRAAELSPSRFPTQVELANVCTRIGRFEEARAILSRFDAHADGAITQVLAQRLGWLAMAQARAALRAELAAAAGVDDAGPDSGIAQTGSFPLPPAFRAPRPGEQRAAGLLDAIVCGREGIAAQVSTRSGPLTLRAASMAELHVASARSTTRGVTCGPRPDREAIYVTWSDGLRLVAIEFLPEDLSPARRETPCP